MANSEDQNLKIQKRVWRLRVVGYSLTGIFTLWLVIATIVSVSAGLRSGAVTDPFTNELVDPSPNEP